MPSVLKEQNNEIKKALKNISGVFQSLIDDVNAGDYTDIYSLENDIYTEAGKFSQSDRWKVP